MTFQSVWWYPNYVEYGSGLKPGKTWPTVMEQYQRPHALYDLRYYDLPVDEYQAKLYYNMPRLGMPKYRASFRDKPHTVSRHYPNGWPEGKPPGFHGRMYYEDGPPQFKYEGPKQDKLYWLEREPYLPSVPLKSKPDSEARETLENLRGVYHCQNPYPPDSARPRPRSEGAHRTSQRAFTTTNMTYGEHSLAARRPDSGKRTTLDGVGFL